MVQSLSTVVGLLPPVPVEHFLGVDAGLGLGFKSGFTPADGNKTHDKNAPVYSKAGAQVFIKFDVLRLCTHLL